MKKSGEVQKHTKGLVSAKYDSRSAEYKQAKKKAKEESMAAESET